MYNAFTNIYIYIYILNILIRVIKWWCENYTTKTTMTTWNQNKIPMIQAFMPEEGFLCWAPLDSISTKGVQQDQNQQTTSAKTQSFWQSCCSVRPGSHRDCPMAQTPTSYVESWKGKWTWNREGLQLPLIVAEAWPPKPGGWKKCFVSLPADGGGGRERERLPVFTCPDSRLEP